MDPDKLKELATEKLGEELANKMYGGVEMGMGPTSFSELLESQKAQEVTEQVYDLSNMFRMLSFNICYNSMVEDKVGALEALTQEYLALVKSATQQTKSAGLLDLIKELKTKAVNLLQRKEGELTLVDQGGSFMIFKDNQGRMRWAAIHTNKYEDSEEEIIASYAHKEFVEAVEAGLWDYPDLWVWHASEKSCIGKADMLHYDETGFMFSTGYIYKDKEHIGEGLARYPHPLRTSHGMPKKELIYEGGLLFDQAMKSKLKPKVIARYRSKEISPLPFGAEANKHTDFAIYGGI